MKAIVIESNGPAEVLKLQEKECPEPRGRQVLVRLKAIGVNPVDTYLRSGEARFMAPPFVPGFDGSGIVESVGNDVRNIKPGDRVFTTLNHGGTYAEFTLAEEEDLLILPENISMDEGAGLYLVYGTAWQALHRICQITGAETVLVHGASGAVGLAAVQMAAAKGCTVIATAGTDAGCRLVKDQGAGHVLNHHLDNHYFNIMEITKGKGVDIIIEMASPNIPRDFSIMAPFGRLIIIGGKEEKETIVPLELTNNGFSITGINIGHLGKDSLGAFYEYLLNGLSGGYLKPVIERSFPLADAAEAHRYFEETSRCGKILLHP